MLLRMLDDEGFAGMYNFLYLPIDFKTQACLGYAFVNLVEPCHVINFWSKFSGFSNWVLPSKKVCSVGWSGPHQGLEAHVERYRSSPVMHPNVPDECKPVVFEQGVRSTFPGPLKAPRLPRVRDWPAAAAAQKQRVSRAAAAPIRGQQHTGEACVRGVPFEVGALTRSGPESRVS
jgi:hypothetical protein